MKISHLRIENFCHIKKVELEVSDFNTLIGPNNSGKSKILEAIHLALTMSGNIPFNEYYYPNNDTAVGSDLKIDILFNLDRDDCEWIKIDPKIVKEVVPSQIPLKLTRDGKNVRLREVALNILCQEEIIKNAQLKNINPNLVLNQIHEAFQKLRQSILHNIDPRIKASERIGSSNHESSWQNKLSKGTGIEKLREVLFQWQERNPHIYDKFTQAVQDLVGFRLDDVSQSYDSYEFIQNYTLNDRNLNPVTLGYGSQRLMNLLLNLFDMNSYIVLIDEPELHLHPGLQHSLMNLLKWVDKQIFIATHSPSFLAFDASSSIFVINDSEEGAKITKVDQLEESRILKGILGIRNRDILFDELIVFVEGDFDEEIIKRLLEARELSLEMLGLDIITLRGGDRLIKNKIREFTNYFNKIKFDLAFIIDKDKEYILRELVENQLISKDHVYYLDPDLEGAFGIERVVKCWNKLVHELDSRISSILVSEVEERLERKRSTYAALTDLAYINKTHHVLPQKRDLVFELIDNYLKETSNLTQSGTNGQIIDVFNKILEWSYGRDISIQDYALQDHVYGEFAEKHLMGVISRGENHSIEIKRDLPQKDYVIGRTLSAFANHKGGDIYFGIHQKTKEILGVENIDGVINRVMSIADNCVPSISNIKFITYKHPNGVLILRVYIRKSYIPIAYEGKYYYRDINRTENQTMTMTELNNFIKKKSPKNINKD